MPYTVTTSYTRGGKTQTKTFGGEDGGGGFPSSIGGFDIGGFSSKFGGMNIDFGSMGGGGGGGGGGGRSSRYSTQRPQVSGRSTRKEKKNPFSGYSKQTYDEIIKVCQEQGCLFEDPEFPAEDGSIFFSRSPPRPFEWKRPSEICSDPQYVSAGASRFDVQQGELGDCWLLAAVASLTCNHKLLNRIILPDQNFQQGSYYGVFRFMFWHQGDWVEIVVDDRLPTYNDRLVFMHSNDQNEFWSALLEKAYAKLNGSYESLKGGSTSEAMEDFTGGVTESFDLRKAPNNLLNIMMKATARGSLMGCSIDADPNQLEAQLANGLVMGHAYSVTSVKLAEIQTPKVSGKIPLIRVRNPWGNEVEWKGAWSDSSAEWQYIPDEEKRNLGIVKEDDGEFWMSFEDWRSNFEKLEICNLGPDSLDEDDRNAGQIRWESTCEPGEWIPRVNAGGCRNFLETFATNPQYRVTLEDPDDDEDDLCTMLVGVLQKDRRKKRKEGLDMLTIGYCIYKMKEDGSSAPLDVRFFKYNASVGKAPSFINMREVCGRHKYSPGTYVIIPSTFEPNQAGEFLVRIFTEKPNTTSEMDEGTGIVENQQRQDQLYGIAPQEQPPSDPYANQDPLPLGFDTFEKTVYQPDPWLAFSWPTPGAPGYGGYPGAAPGPPGYQPYGQGPAPGAPGYAPYGGQPQQPYQNPSGFQGMPDAPCNPYNPSAGYQQPPQQPGQYFPHPAYEAGYQPNNSYAGPTPPGYQPNQYAGNQQYPAQLGFGGAPPTSQGQYPIAPSYDTSQQYGAPTPSYPAQSQPGYPYGGGEAMERAQSSSSCMAEPGYPGVSPPPPPQRNAPQPSGRKGAQASYSHGGMRSDPRPPSPIIRSYKEAIAYLRKLLDEEAPPVTEEDKAQGEALRESFKRTAGEDMEIDAYELREILNAVFTREFQFDGFSVDVCRSMVAMHDGDCSGKLGFDEFKILWQDLRKWKAVFKKFDKDQSGKLSSYELRTALHDSGFRLSNRSLSSLIMRYSDKNGEIEFDDFVLCAIRLKTMIASWVGNQVPGKGFAPYDIDTFIQTTMYS